MASSPKGGDFSQLGSTGLRRSGGQIIEEFLPYLRGIRGAKTYREMADNDPSIGALLFAIEKVITRLEWSCNPYDDKSDDGEPSPADVEAAQFIETCMNDMSESWDSTLSQILSMLVFGYSYHEIVYKRRVGPEEKDGSRRSKFADNKIGWRKLPIRAQETLYQWKFADDGGIVSMSQIDPSNGGMHEIPIEKALLFRTHAQKNNPEGRSILRNSYRSWYYKKRIEEIEAVGVERDLAGLPVAYVPPEYLSPSASPEQKTTLLAIQTLVSSIKRNEGEGVVFPTLYDESGHKLFDLQLLSTGGSRQFDTDKIVQRYDHRIMMSTLSEFLLLGSDQVGSYALGATKMDLWSMGVGSIAKNIAEVFNQYAIPRLMLLNGMDITRQPQIVFSEVSHVDLTEIADYISKLVLAGAILPDPKLEDHLRDIADMPAGDHEGQEAGQAPMPSKDGLMPDGTMAPHIQQANDQANAEANLKLMGELKPDAKKDKKAIQPDSNQE